MHSEFPKLVCKGICFLLLLNFGYDYSSVK